MVGQLFLVQSCVGSIPTIPGRKVGHGEGSKETGRTEGVSTKNKTKKDEMLTNRVTARKTGYQAKKEYVEVPYTNPQVLELVEKRCEEGYLRAWAKQDAGVKVYLRYRPNGVPCIANRKRRSKPSRKRSADARKRWGVNGDRGTRVRQTSKGRKNSVEARKAKVGGVLYRWVR